MIDINDYKSIYERDIKSVTKIWCLVIIFIIIGIFFINKSFKYIKYYSNIGEYKDNYLNLYVLIDDLNKITKNKKIIIEEKEFAYETKEISADNIYLNSNYYKVVKILVKDKKLKENEIVNIQIIEEEMSILDYVFKTVWR